MSSYSRIIFFIVLLFSSVSCAKQQNNTTLFQVSHLNQKEDLYILIALDNEERKNYDNSFKYYHKLYTLAKTEVYLKKAIFYGYKTKKFKLLSSLCIDALKQFPKNKEYYTQQLIISLLSQNKIKKALKKALILLDQFNNSTNYEIVANIYYAKKD